jgi:hypothetical protein
VSRAALAVHTTGVAIALAVAGCGELIRLGDGPSGSDAAIGQGGEGGGACPTGQVQASQVLWIGDSWVQLPGTQHTIVRDRARAAQAIGPNDDYADSAASGATMSAIAGQYATREAGQTKVKILIMDGGGLDLLEGNGSSATIMSVYDTFQQLLATVASDGTVEQIIYFLVPEAGSTNVPGLRPWMEMACAASAVPCHFLDLQPYWAGHPEYSNTIQASDLGAQVIGNQIWSLMQQNCIGQ